MSLSCMKLEFVPAAENPAYFIVVRQSAQSFIHHLKSQNVLVHPPNDYLTQSGIDYVTLELQSPISPDVGKRLAATFQT